jgi:hypothetical protein
MKPFESKVAKRFSSVDAWMERRDADFCIAVIHLDEPFFGESDAFRVGSLPDDELQDYLVNVGGYPAGPGGGTELWWAKNRIKVVKPRRIFYDVDTSGGQNAALSTSSLTGSPVPPWSASIPTVRVERGRASAESEFRSPHHPAGRGAD